MAYLREVELRYRISEIDSGAIGEKVTSAETIMRLFGDLQNESKEKLIAISLDSQHHILCFEVVAIGSIKSIYLRPMEVVRSAIVLNAASLIVVHNHPSGTTEPSPGDIELTRKLLRITKDLGLKLLDHIIIGLGEYYSFADRGVLASLTEISG